MGWSYTIGEAAQVMGAAVPRNADRSFTGVSTDTRKIAPGQLFFALPGENFDGNRFVADAFARGAAGAVCSEENAAGPCIVVDDPLAALQRFAAAHRQRYQLPLIAITGSCGKTSAKDFCAALLATRFPVAKTQGNLNNDIGCPLSLLEIDETTRAAVIEMGANHLGEIGQLCRIARPTESAITLVAPAHLEGFGSIERVAAAKGEIASGLGPAGTFYVNMADEWCRRVGEHYRGQKIAFGPGTDFAIESQRYDDAGEMELELRPIGTLRLPLPIPVQAENVLLAVCIALHHGVTEFEGPLRAACAASTRFRIETVGPLTIIDDSYNANPASVEAALAALAARPATGRRFAALGGMLELGGDAESWHRRIGEAAGRHGIDGLFARGEFACAMIGGARQTGVTLSEHFDTHAAIAEAIAANAAAGDVLLVKGSRGYAMERVIDALRAHYGTPAQSAPAAVQHGS